MSATTELADNGDNPDLNKDERSLLAESVQALQMLAKSTAACRSRISAIFGWDEFFIPEDSRRNVDPGDRQRPKISFNTSSRQRKGMSIGLAVSRSIARFMRKVAARK